MKFKDLKSGFPLYLLDRTTMTFSTEKVASVSLPHIDPKMSSSGMVVDVTTDKTTYCMTADSDVAYPNNRIISTEQQSILRELNAIKATAEQALAQVDHNRQLVTKCNQLIADLDPVQKEKQATEQRLTKMEDSISKMMSMLTKLTE